jgi:hypothetical protein
MAVCLALLVAYSFAIAKGIPGWANRPESQWGQNIAAAEQVIFAEDCPPIVLVGSSLLGRVPAQEIGEGSFNLSFAAMSAVEGLRVLHRSGQVPGLILVEVNMLFLPEDKEFSDSLFRPGLHSIHHVMPALRETYRPLNNLARLSFEAARRLSGKAPRGSVDESSVSNSPTGPHRAVLFEAMLRRELAKHASIPSLQVRSHLRATLRTLLGDLVARGAKILLVELPVDHRVSATPYYSGLRIFLDEALADLKLLRLPMSSEHDYETTDGVHMTPSDARRFASEVRKQMTALGY